MIFLIYIYYCLYLKIEPNEVIQNVSLVNSSILRYLYLEGNYYVDEPLIVPSLFVLNLTNSYIVDGKNLSKSKYNNEIVVKPIINPDGDSCSKEKIILICQLILRLQFLWIIFFNIIFFNI